MASSVGRPASILRYRKQSRPVSVRQTSPEDPGGFDARWRRLHTTVLLGREMDVGVSVSEGGRLNGLCRM